MADGDDNRLIATMGLMARTIDNEALIALRQATRMLSARGLRWEDVARAIVEMRPTAAEAPRRRAAARESAPPPPPPPSPPPPHRADAEERRARRNAERARTYQGGRPRRTVKGFDIPESVRGRVVVQDEKRTKAGDEYLVVSVDNDDTVWGPLMVFDDHLRALMHYADGWLTVEIQQPANSLYHPIIVNAEQTG